MSNEIATIRCTLMRGGTSKAVFLQKSELPEDPVLRDKVILSLFGSPSLRQLDGLGGADSTTSKVAIIAPPSRGDADIDYTFGQVGLREAFVDYGGNCGNISSAVGPYAIFYGLVPITEPYTVVRIHMTNTGHILRAKVRVENGKPCVDGDCVIGGVPGTASPIEMDWSLAVGCTTGKILPTGHATDTFEMDGTPYTVSIVDGGNNVIYARASDFGLTGTETPDEINTPERLAKIERLRGIVCQYLGLVGDWREAAQKMPYQPFFCLVSPAADYTTYTGERISKEDVDLVVRLYVMGLITKAYPGTATVSTGCAARIKGTLVEQLMSRESLQKQTLNLGHPTGFITVTSIVEPSGGLVPTIRKMSFIRTARVLMEGYAFVRKSTL